MLPKSLPNFRHTSVMVLGDIMLDRYWFGNASRLSPEAPVPIVNIRSQEQKPGGAGNVALNIAALGAQVKLLGVTGKDEAANLLDQLFTAANVQHDLIQYPNNNTIIKLRVISRHQQLIRIDFEEKNLIIDPDILLDRCEKQMRDVKLLILSDYQKGTLVNPQPFIQLAKKMGITTLVDPKSNDFNLYRHADIVTPNFKEFEAIVGQCHSEQDILTRAQKLLSDYEIGALLLTRGEQGMTLFRNGEESIHFPAYAREVFDVTGAGDTVIAMLGVALAGGLELPAAASLANLAASLVVGKLGAAIVTPPELEAALSQKTSYLTGILNEEQLDRAVKEARSQGKKIVFTNGCFDILHAGHVTYLQQAKQLGDILIVALNDDASVKNLKGPGRPINNIEQRMTVMASINAVDWVVSFSDPTPKRLLKRLQPDMLVKGGDYTIDQVVGAEIVYAYGGEVRVLSLGENISTTLIIDRIKQSQLRSVVND